MVTAQLPAKLNCLFTPSQFKAIYGGRGGGKSRTIGTVLLLLAAQKPLRVLCAREIQRSIADSVKRLLDDEIARLGLQNFYKSTNTYIEGKNGSLFVFAGLKANPASIKSMEAIDIAWVEEADTVSAFSLEKLIPTVRATGSELWFSWNPGSPKDPVDKIFRGGNIPPDTIIQEINYWDNPWFPEELRRIMEWDKRRDEDKYRHVWCGEYLVHSEAQVFKNWRTEAFDTPRNASQYHGADWGFSQDPTTLVSCWVNNTERKIWVEHEAWGLKCEIDKTPALFDTVPGAKRARIRADSARPETISHMKRQGYNVTGARKGAGSVMEGVKFLQSYDIVVHPRCEHTIDELTHYKYKMDPKTDEILSVLVDKNNHMIDALRYALEDVRQSAWIVV